MTEQRPLQPTPAGALRFNTETAQLEYFNGSEYVTIISDSPEKHTGGTRLLFGGGYGSGPHPAIDSIDFVNVATIGNASDFGNLTT